MKILLVRHAIAEDPRAFRSKGRGDRLRPLTADGRMKMLKAARGLKKVLPRTSAIVSSPFVRARETAQLLGRSFSLPVEENALLEPSGGVEKVMRWLEAEQARRKDGALKKGVIVLVGHEPQLGHLLGYLLTGSRRSIIKLKKGSATLVSCKLGPIRSGRVLWSLTGKQLRQVAKKGAERSAAVFEEMAA